MWDKTIQDLGDVQSGSPIPVVFTYTGPLTIKSVKTSCGCTVAEYPKTEKGYVITASFTPRSNSRVYKKNGTITVTFSDNTIQHLKFQSNVQTGDN